jgi:hypothetical protein
MGKALRGVSTRDDRSNTPSAKPDVESVKRWSYAQRIENRYTEIDEAVGGLIPCIGRGCRTGC